MKNKYRGFTVVELVIVIAVIAVLAAVLIPTFAAIVKNANISADTQAARNMNVILASESADSPTPDGLASVIALLEANGITDFTPELLTTYVFESDREKELVFAHKAVYDGEVKPSEELDGGRFWPLEEVKNNLGKGIFTPNFESEYQRCFGK